MKVFVVAWLVAMGACGQSLLAEKSNFIAEMTDLLLDGRDAPNDIYQRVIALQPVERFEVVAFLRRSGLLTGPVWSVDALLEEATQSHIERQVKDAR